MAYYIIVYCFLLFTRYIVSGHHFLSESSFWNMHFLMNFLTNVASLQKKCFFFF